MKALSKELFIMALLLMVVVFMVGLIFYQYMPNNKTVPEPVSYRADSSTTSILQEIASTSTDDGSNSTGSEAQSIIKSYSIGSQELSTAASKQSFTSGKTDPFAEYVEPTASNTTNTTGTNTTTITNTTQGTTSNSNGSQTNTKSNSTGTFFEKPNSK